MLWLIGGVMAAVVTVLFVRGTRKSDRIAAQPGTTGILRPPHIFSSGRFFSPTLIRSNVLNPSLLSNTNTFYAPTLVVSSGLVAPLLTNANSFFAPQLNQSLVASLFTNTASLFAPVVARLDGLAASLFTNTQTFFGPTLHQSLRPSLVSNSQTFFPVSATLGSSPGYALSSPSVSVTSAAGDPPAIDLTINADHYAGYYLDIQRSTSGAKNPSDNSYVSPTLNISHQITPSEVAALAIPPANLAADGYFDPSGAYFQQYRIRREDGALSPWVEISGTVTASVAVLHSVTGADKNQYLSVSGTPKLVATGTNGVGAAHCSRATVAATGKRQFEVTVTSYGNNNIAIGVENGTTNLNSGFPAPGISNANGVGLRISNTAFAIFKAGVSVSSGSTSVATGDVLTMTYDSTAGTASFYRTRSGTTIQIGSTVTGISLSAWNAYLGCWSAGTLTANFGASAFTRALDTGYSYYG
jgi:hypothetical protein